MRKRFSAASIGVMVLLLFSLSGHAVHAQDQAVAPPLHVVRPVDGATVREQVPIKIAESDLPTDGYVSISIDGQFKLAQVLPADKSQAVYVWDTKASYTTSDDPDTPKFYQDGDHTVAVEVYDSVSKRLGAATVNVHVENNIIAPAEGVKLVYHWKLNETLHYRRNTQLDTLSQQGGPPQNLQTSSVKFTRSVEDVGGGTYLIRDRVDDNGVVVNNGQAQVVQTAYRPKAKFRTVDIYGNVLGQMDPLSVGNHFGFSIPILPTRRVGTGDSWRSPVQISLQWAATEPATVQAESRLEGFQWQNGYPTAKIHETYSGLATFHLLDGSTLNAQSVDFDRIIYFAYNSGRLIRTETTLTVTSLVTSGQLSALGGAANANGTGPGAGLQPPGSVGNSLDDGSGTPYPGAPGFNGGLPGLGTPGATFGRGGAVVEQKTPLKMKATEQTSVLM